MRDNTKQIRDWIERESATHPLGDISRSYRAASWRTSQGSLSRFATASFDLSTALQHLADAVRPAQNLRYRAAVIDDHGVSSIDVTNYVSTDGFNFAARPEEPRP